MKKIFTLVLVIFIIMGLTGCNNRRQSETPQENQNAMEANQKETTEESTESELLNDPGFVGTIYSTFDKIGINAMDKDIVVVEERETSGTKSVDAVIEHDGINMEISLMYVSDVSNPEWIPVAIKDSETRKFYWVLESTEDYADIYDWKTGELISEKTKEFE